MNLKNRLSMKPSSILYRTARWANSFAAGKTNKTTFRLFWWFGKWTYAFGSRLHDRGL